jgi:hypothetical protein
MRGVSGEGLLLCQKIRQVPASKSQKHLARYRALYFFSGSRFFSATTQKLLEMFPVEINFWLPRSKKAKSRDI